MLDSHTFLRHILDTVLEQIVVIDESGEIVYVNRSWLAFCSANNGPDLDDWDGINYLTVCDNAADLGDDFGSKASAGIKSVIRGETEAFYLEYPCHSEEERRWFIMRVIPLKMRHGKFFVISHQNITERKMIENEIFKLSRLDGLTNIPNRRYFDEFFQAEWNRCRRLKKPISLAMIDLDHFKILNDTYGHLEGDACLLSIGKLAKQFCQRPSDLCARYGGEEFVLLYGATSLQQAKTLAENFLEGVRALKIHNEKAPHNPYLTASIGVASMLPGDDNQRLDLVERADELLYQAKSGGRNRLVSCS